MDKVNPSIEVRMKRVSKQAKKSLQEKWVKIKPFGKPINITLLERSFQGESETDPFHNYNIYLCPFKTPLDERYSDMIDANKMLTTTDVIKHYKQQDVELKVVYDLCNTERYYDH